MMNSVGKAVYQKAKDLYAAKEYKKAENILKRLFKEHSRDVYVNHLMAIVLMRLNRNTETIVGHLKNVIYLKAPARLMERTYLLLSYLYLQKGQYALAEKHLKELETRSCRQVEMYALLGYVLYQRKDYRGAETYYQKALDLDPENANSLNGLGCSYLEMKINLTKAKSCITRALEKDENNYAYLESMGWYYMLTRNMRDAFNYLKRSIETHWHAITARKLKQLRRYFR